MTSDPLAKDLIVLVADKNMEFALNGILARPESVGMRPISSEVHRHPERDPGCFLDGPDFLRLAVRQAYYALLIMDFEGSGQDNRMAAPEMESDVEGRLARSGWSNRAAAIVIEPELDIWIWSDSPHVDEALGWAGRSPRLREWLSEKGFVASHAMKPSRPKEALEAAIREVRKPRSSSLYQALAEKVSFERCTDQAFVKLRRTLRRWFPRQTGA